MQRIVWWVLAVFLSLFGFACLGGCTINLQGTGELGVKQTSSWSMYHRSEQEAIDTEASAGVDAPSVVGWLTGLGGSDNAPVEPEPEPADDAEVP